MKERDAVLSEASIDDRKSSFEKHSIDAGLRSHMLRIYNYMAFGLAVTGLAAVAVYGISVTSDIEVAARVLRGGVDDPVRFGADTYFTPLGFMVFFGPTKWSVMLAPLALVIGLSFGIHWLRPFTAQVVFWVYATLLGVSLGAVFMVYAHASVARAFFVASAAFGAFSLWGYVAKHDVTAVGSFLIMGVCGAVIATAVNIVLPSTMLQWITSVIGVLVFAGLTAWDTRRLKNEYIYGAMDGDAAARAAIVGALSLYLDCGNVFLLMLELPGHRDD
jgi:FtsH-binding integral membrane protein